MPTVVLAALLALAVPAAAATVERVEIKGAHALVTIPDDWNGSLFLYAHGYTSDSRIVGPIPQSITDAVPVLWPGMLRSCRRATPRRSARSARRAGT